MSGQGWLALSVIAAAGAYLALHLFRSVATKDGGCCGDKGKVCDCRKKR